MWLLWTLLLSKVCRWAFLTLLSLHSDFWKGELHVNQLYYPDLHIYPFLFLLLLYYGFWQLNGSHNPVLGFWYWNHFFLSIYFHFSSFTLLSLPLSWRMSVVLLDPWQWPSGSQQPSVHSNCSLNKSSWRDKKQRT